MASMCSKRLKCLRNGFTMLKMTEEFDKWLIYVGNDVYMWGNGSSISETAKICWK